MRIIIMDDAGNTMFANTLPEKTFSSGRGGYFIGGNTKVDVGGKVHTLQAQLVEVDTTKQRVGESDTAYAGRVAVGKNGPVTTTKATK